MIQSLFIQQTTQDNALLATWALLRALSLHDKITLGSVRDFFLAHPEYPSLQSVSDVLTHFKIENAAFKLELPQLRALPSPVLVHLHTKRGIFVVITEQGADTITYTDGISFYKVAIAEFSKSWTGFTLIAEPSPKVGEANYATKRKQERWQSLRLPTLVALGTLIPVGVALAFHATFSWVWGFQLLLKLLGVALSGSLLSLHIVGKQSFASSFCQVGDKTDCNAILSSPAAMLWGLISWAEVGFIYYAGSLLSLLVALVSEQTGGVLSILSVLSWMALPYPIFSVYYQWCIAKQWCPLCLGVQGVLLAEAALSTYGFPLTELGLATLMVMLLSFGIVLAGWLVTKPLWQASLQLRKTKRELSKFKNNPEVFEQLLRQQPAMPPLPAAVKAIRLGASEAEAQHTLVVVTNPYCGPCAKAHQQLEELLANHPKLCIYLIFTTCYSEKIRRFVSHILSLSSVKMVEAFSNWHSVSDKNYESWAERFPVEKPSTDDTVISTIDAYCEWTNNPELKGTPTFYFNGSLLPKLYRLSDLKWVLSSMNKSHSKGQNLTSKNFF